MTPSQDLDVLIVGAGVSGIGMACALRAECPHKRFAILERRARIGGTWDLFRYPGVRSDSDMFTYGFKRRPWWGLKVLADGASIRDYLVDTARESGIDEHIHYGLKITRADWSSAQQRWTVSAMATAAAPIHLNVYGPDLVQLDKIGGGHAHARPSAVPSDVPEGDDPADPPGKAPGGAAIKKKPPLIKG